MSIRVRIVVSLPRGLQAGNGSLVSALILDEHAAMLIRRESPFDWVLLLLLAAMVVAGYGVAANITYQAAILSLVVTSATAVVLAGAAGIRWGFIFWICTLGLGYRTAAVTPILKVHPGELVLWGLLLWLMIWAALDRRMRAACWLPPWVWMFLPFCVWGWMIGQENGVPWDRMLSEMKVFLLLIPLYMLASTILVQKGPWRTVVLSFFLIATGIAALGLVEYFDPGITALFPKFIADPEASETMEGFARARFSFWGGPAATYACILAVPFAIPLWRWANALLARLFILCAGLLLIGAVYAGGFRIFWLLLAIQCLLFLVLTRRYVLVGVLALASLAGYRTLPDATQERIHSLAQILLGKPTDTSGVKHLNRPRAAIELCLNSPAGSGWGAAGWVHSDFIQIAANLGILAGLLFFGAYVATLLRLWRRVRTRGRARAEWSLDAAFLLSFLTAGGIICTQAVLDAPQLAFPVWFVWVLADVMLRQSRLGQKKTVGAANLASSVRLPLQDTAGKAVVYTA
ncbi:MAG: hypothetical protein LAP39_29050 [Acidobacteriia bacterium]|nr:hypothetical protein [Terriglobia bacterium]